MSQYEDVTIDQGADVTIQLELVDTNGNTKNLTDHTVAGKVKKTYNSDSDYTWDFGSTIPSPASDGIVNLTLTNTQTDTMKAGRYVYDVELSYADSAANTIIERILEGQLNVTPSVTR